MSEWGFYLHHRHADVCEAFIGSQMRWLGILFGRVAQIASRRCVRGVHRVADATCRCDVNVVASLALFLKCVVSARQPD